MNTINILTTMERNNAHKTYKKHSDGLIEEIAYRAGNTFTRDAAPVTSIKEFSGLLFDLENSTQSFIIRGEILPQFENSTTVTRTILDDPERKQTAYFREYADGLNWIMLDFDKIQLPSNVPPVDSIEMLVQSLPKEFHNVSYHYQFSSSAGIEGEGFTIDPYTKERNNITFAGWNKVSAHVFFWLKDKITGKDINQWAINFNQLQSRRIFDPSTLRTVQPNYTSKPTFIGMDDPVIHTRSGFVEKENTEVHLVNIPTPDRFVNINGKQEKVGSYYVKDGETFIVSESFQDKLQHIGSGGGYREPLKKAINYYWRRNGTYGDALALRDAIYKHWEVKGFDRKYLGRALDDLIKWGERIHGNHTPTKNPNINFDKELKEKLISLKEKAKRQQQEEQDHNEEVPNEWDLEFEDLRISFARISGECGQGKTEWEIDLIGAHPKRYICCVPTIQLMESAMDRLRNKYGDLEKTVNYKFKIIHSDTRRALHDEEENEDETQATVSVNEQIAKFRVYIDRNRKRNVVLFITHQALFQGDWTGWGDFELIIDEIPEPYITWTKNFTQNSEILFKLFQTAELQSNYYRLQLTDIAEDKFKDEGNFDNIDEIFIGMMESIRSPNMELWVQKQSWDDIKAQRVRFIRIINPKFLDKFHKVTIMGDEFDRSLLALTWKYAYNVEWTDRSDWNPRVRQIPLNERVRIHYFATKAESRASRTLFEDKTKKIIPILREWMEENVDKPTLITTNRNHQKSFPSEVTSFRDVNTPDGVERHTISKDPKFLWKQPKMHGIDDYKYRTSVAWFAAMRPGNDEIVFLNLALGISEAEIIRWREYNAMYQFIMRICTRIYDSKQEADIYVFDEHQVEYLVERFNGAVDVIHHGGLFGDIHVNKSGPKKKEHAKTSTERSRERRQRQREEAKNTSTTEEKTPKNKLKDLARRLRE